MKLGRQLLASLLIVAAIAGLVMLVRATSGAGEVAGQVDEASAELSRLTSELEDTTGEIDRLTSELDTTTGELDRLTTVLEELRAAVQDGDQASIDELLGITVPAPTGTESESP